MSNASGTTDASEVMLRNALEEAGYPDLASSTDKTLLLSAGEAFRKGSMTKVEEEYKSFGRTVRWNVASQRFILDRLFGIDSLIAPSGDNDQFAFDITRNPADVTKKVSKHRHLLQEGIWQKAGLSVTKSSIILLVLKPKWDNGWGWGMLNNQEKEDFLEEVLQVVYAMDERSATVTSHIINF